MESEGLMEKVLLADFYNFSIKKLLISFICLEGSAMKFGMDMHVPGMNCNHFSDPLLTGSLQTFQLHEGNAGLIDD